jgi:hypothetical protein
MNPDVIRQIKQAAIGLDKTASEVMEEAAKEWLERHKRKPTWFSISMSASAEATSRAFFIQTGTSAMSLSCRLTKRRFIITTAFDPWYP